MAKKKVTPEQVEAAERQLKELQRQVEYDTKDYTLELLLDKFEKGDFYIPDYQRQFVWKPNNRSLFIESVLLGLPIPFMFFAGCDDGRLEIIDGAQRMQTLREFVKRKMKLSKLAKLTELDGFVFEDLSTATQRKFLNRTFRVVVLDEKTTTDIRQDLFNRINTSGVKASDSEVRRGSYPGKLTSYIEKCCKHKIRYRVVDDQLALEKVRKKRNALAHGDESFSRCARDLTISDLGIIKDTVIRFISEIVEGMEKYCNEKQYLRAQ